MNADKKPSIQSKQESRALNSIDSEINPTMSPVFSEEMKEIRLDGNRVETSAFKVDAYRQTQKEVEAGKTLSAVLKGHLGRKEA